MDTVNRVGTFGDKGGDVLAGRYRVTARLASGAQGDVFLSEDSKTGACCTMKVLGDQGPAAHLRREFARLSELAHPNIVRVVDAGVLKDGAARGRAFLVTEYLAGPSLADALPPGPLAQRLACFIAAAEGLADALAYLHGRGFIHGDISPANVRCDDAGKPILIDFGLAAWLDDGTTAGQGVTGTLGFIAPEALLGERTPAGDLFGLGATLFHAWTGAPPFGLGMEAVRRAWQGPPPAPSTLHAGLPPAWDALVLGLLAAEAHDRPRSARALLREIRRLMPGRAVEVENDLAVPFPVGDPLAGIFVGRADEQATIAHELEQLAQGAATVSAVAVVGPAFSGRRSLIRQALRDLRLAMLAQTIEPVEIQEGDVCDSALADTSPAQGAATALADPLQASQRLAAFVAQLERRADRRPICLSLSGSAEDHMLVRALAANPPSGRLLALLPCTVPPADDGVAVVRLSPLDRSAVATLMQGTLVEAPTDREIDRIVTASAGLAGLVSLLVRQWIASRREGRSPEGMEAAQGAELDQVLDASLSALSPSARGCVVAAALLAGDAMECCADASTGGAEAQTAGWLTPDGVVPTEAHLGAVWRAVSGDAALRAVAEAGALRLPPDDPRRGEVELALGHRTQAAACFWQAMATADAKSAFSKVAHFGLRALGAGDGQASDAQRMSLSHALGVLGRYDEALQVLDGANPGAGSGVARVAERKAWLLGRRGDPEGARELLDATIRTLPPEGEEALLLHARLARLLVASGRYADALRAAEPALRATEGPGIAAREAAVLALAYGGNLPAAQALLDRLHTDVHPGEHALAARVAALEGLVAQLDGKPVVAAASYQRAVADYEVVHDLHGSAAASFNLGCTLAEIGDYGKAMAALERAVRELGRLGAVTDHALAVFNIGQLFLQLGDLGAASRAVERLAVDARASRVEAFAGHVHLLRGELERRRGASTASAQAYAAAAEVFTRMGMTSLSGIARAAEAEVLAQQGRVGEARARLAGLPADAKTATDAAMGEARALAAGRVALADPQAQGDELHVVGETAATLATTAKQSGRLPAAWRAASLAARLYARVEDPRQRPQWDLARACFEEVKMKTPPQYWSGWGADVEAQVLSPSPTEARSASALAAQSALLESRLRRLLRINKRLNSELRLSRVLETIIDTVIELTDAERGFLLLRDANGELVVKVARNIDQTTLEGPALSLSRSIAKQAADSGEPVVTVDAAGDSRFSEHLSVSDLHLRSVLAVPLAIKGRVVGTIYVDHRLRKGVFGDDELAMVLDFAEQGAIAIENARVISELRRREQQVQSLNHRLERELRAQEAALSEARSELKETRQAVALRYDYRQIVGRSPAMLELFRLLDRVTDTDLPVVIEGESGTGKELVARAIHVHGRRKDKPFVSENCAAIPETLLESALFGHVRGAFTGAERETRGLFAIAHGGTLFLDEVADMSPAMQGKLLRVLQDGEFHRVGGERAEKADVRVVVASNQNLGRLVEDGKFRKDLFYRLSVLRLYLPPLRERREDIPLLVQHFLTKLAEPGASAKTVEAPALARLCAYAWPGNVRELENEIARAAAFAGAAIGVSDLSAHVQTGQDPTEVLRNEPDSLRLHQRVERLERQLIREAMTRVQGNQTKAAALLGLSRFGLQKKLRRYNLGG